MGFIVMVLSMIIGIFLITLGFLDIKRKRNKLYTIITILTGMILVFFAIWLGLPK